MSEAVSSIPPPPKPATRAIGRRPRMSHFLRILLMITAVFQIASALAWAELARRAKVPWPPLFGVVAWSLGMASFLWVVRRALMDRRRSPWSIRLIDVPVYVHWCASVISLFALVIASLVLVTISRADLVIEAALDGYLGGLAVAAYGVVIRRWWFVVRHIDVEIEDLPPAFDGFRIAHLSDMHIGMHSPRHWGERWVRAANAADVDLAVVTGDMVTSGSEYHQDIADIIAGLRARYGTFVSMGNHDYFGEGEPLISLIRESGVTVLRNEGRVIEKEGEAIYLAAIDDTWTRRDDLARALSGRSRKMPTILLAHDPERFRAAARAGCDLVLSGHTHGGQVGLPFFTRWVNFSRLAHHYHLGIYKKGKSTLYVHPGLGVTGPPVRIGVAPAVVILTLRRKLQTRS